jgi:hypothetical protein
VWFYCKRVEFFFKRERKKGGGETDNVEADEDRNKGERMRGKRAEAGRWGQVRRDKEERERKAHKRVDDATPVSGPFLKAVVASQDLGAAGTEFERSLISFPPCNKNYHFLLLLSALLSLLFHPQSLPLSRNIIPPIYFYFYSDAKEAAWADFCFVRCFSRSAFLVACVTRSNEIYPIGDQLISPLPIFPDLSPDPSRLLPR